MRKSEKEKMQAGEPYFALDGELVRARDRARALCAQLNASAPTERARREAILRELFGRVGPGVWVEPPFQCDYGSHIFLGDRVYFNFNCVILDPGEVHIGHDVKFGPAVQVYTAYHPTDPSVRRSGLEMASPIRIGDNVWVGGGVIICPGVEIGADSVLGAGSVVTRSIPAGVVAVGNPCRVIRQLG